MGKDNPIAVHISGAGYPDCKVVEEMVGLVNHQVIERFIGDKGYHIHSEIPNKKNRKVPFRFDKTVYKWRYKIEN